MLDGEILAWRGEGPLSFGTLQRRLGRRSVSGKTRMDLPVAFVAYDILESRREDTRARTLAERRQLLERIISEVSRLPTRQSFSKEAQVITPYLPGLEGDLEENGAVADTSILRLSPLVRAASWDELSKLHGEARSRGVEGLMLKRLNSAYGVGRQRGDWWKWKIDPLVIDAVLVAAQRGHGRRASLYTDYTFGLWDKGELVPVAKAYSGLTDEEILQVDSFVRQNITGKYGPVRSVKPTHVFELAFEGIQRSTRHKSGVAVRFPRMNRWRHDKRPEDADTLDNLVALAKFAEIAR